MAYVAVMKRNHSWLQISTCLFESLKNHLRECDLLDDQQPRPRVGSGRSLLPDVKNLANCLAVRSTNRRQIAAFKLDHPVGWAFNEDECRVLARVSRDLALLQDGHPVLRHALNQMHRFYRDAIRYGGFSLFQGMPAKYLMEVVDGG
jgi:hypothetical protein